MSVYILKTAHLLRFAANPQLMRIITQNKYNLKTVDECG